MVEKGVLAPHRHFYNQFLIIFHFSNPNSNIKSQREFRLELVKQLVVQPLLNLKASPECPSVLQSHKGRSVISPGKRLTGKCFSYKAIERGRCCVCSKHRSSRGWTKRRGITAPSVKFIFALVNVSNSFIPSPSTSIVGIKSKQLNKLNAFHSTLCTLCIFLPL